MKCYDCGKPAKSTGFHLGGHTNAIYYQCECGMRYSQFSREYESITFGYKEPFIPVNGSERLKDAINTSVNDTINSILRQWDASVAEITGRRRAWTEAGFEAYLRHALTPEEWRQREDALNLERAVRDGDIPIPDGWENRQLYKLPADIMAVLRALPGGMCAMLTPDGVDFPGWEPAPPSGVIPWHLDTLIGRRRLRVWRDSWWWARRVPSLAVREELRVYPRIVPEVPERGESDRTPMLIEPGEYPVIQHPAVTGTRTRYREIADDILRLSGAAPLGGASTFPWFSEIGNQYEGDKALCPWFSLVVESPRFSVVMGDRNSVFSVEVKMEVTRRQIAKVFAWANARNKHTTTSASVDSNLHMTVQAHGHYGKRAGRYRQVDLVLEILALTNPVRSNHV